MRNPHQDKDSFMGLNTQQMVVFYGLIILAMSLIGTIVRMDARISDLELQRDIYKLRFENWSQRALDDEEKLDQLQSSIAEEAVIEAEPMSYTEVVETVTKPSATPAPTVTVTTTPKATPKPTETLAESIDISSEGEVENIDEENGINYDWTYAGEFMCTAYCCEKYKHICGEGKGITASGAPVTAGTTVAADTSRFEFGTVLYIEGVGYRTVQDKGSAIKGNKLDVAVDTHANALKWSGYGKHRVWVVSTP